MTLAASPTAAWLQSPCHSCVQRWQRVQPVALQVPPLAHPPPLLLLPASWATFRVAPPHSLSLMGPRFRRGPRCRWAGAAQQNLKTRSTCQRLAELRRSLLPNDAQCRIPCADRQANLLGALSTKAGQKDASAIPRAVHPPHSLAYPFCVINTLAQKAMAALRATPAASRPMAARALPHLSGRPVHARSAQRSSSNNSSSSGRRFARVQCVAAPEAPNVNSKPLVAPGQAQQQVCIRAMWRC